MAAQPNPPPSAATPIPVEIVPQPMTRWFNPGELLGVAVETLLGSIFGSFMDRRELQAAIDVRAPGDPEIFDYSNDPDAAGFWIDYVADLGDGWNPTYTVARALAQPALQVNGTETKRGRVLVMGGDQVYPAANADQYQRRMKDPYRAALPWIANPAEQPHLFAIPGNHDWYDGLGSFLKAFCQQRAIGAWQTRQHRSYFALKLPHNWWLWAVDVQLETDIDLPQKNYFLDVAQKLDPGAKVILCTATSSWVRVRADGTPPKSGQNLEFIERAIRGQGGEVPLVVGGDLHHYSHYASASVPEEHRVTSGGGGAFLLGTNWLPKTLSIPPGQGKPFALKQTYPSKWMSKALSLATLRFSWKNWQLSGLLGCYTLLYAWILQTSSRIPNPHLQAPSLLDVLENLIRQCAGLWDFVCAFYNVLSRSPTGSLLTVLTILAFFGFSLRQPDGLPRYVTWPWGIGHGVLQIIVAFTVITANAGLSVLIGWVWPGWGQGGWADGIAHIALFGTVPVLLGGALGGTLMGLYLYLAAALSKLHVEEVFSAQGIEGYKNFVRLHVTQDALTVYAIGVDTAHQRWKLRAGADIVPASPPKRGGWNFTFTPPAGVASAGEWIQPKGKPKAPHLIESFKL